MAFIYLFLTHRFSKKITLAVCFAACFVMNLLDYLKLNLLADNGLVYFFTTITQIAMAQFTGLFIAKKRDSRVLFIGLSASNYVIVGSITASILYIYPQNILVSIFLMVTMLVSYVVVMRYLHSETKQVEAYWKNVMFESYLKGLESQNYLVERSEQNLRILRHDMRHYSSMIDSLLSQGNYEEIRKIAGHISDVVDENKVEKYCENLIVGTILLKMAEQAKLFQIKLHMDVLIPKEIPVNEYEFAMVVANLLENKCEGNVNFDSLSGLPKSGKGAGHGLGMQSVQAFSDKLGEILHVTVKMISFG